MIMLMIACSGMALVLEYKGSHNGPRPKPEGHYALNHFEKLQPF